MSANEDEILYFMLKNSFESPNSSAPKNLLNRYRDLCELYNEVPEKPFCKIRLYQYFLGQYHTECGAPIRAEIAYREALHADAPAYTLKLLPDVQIKYELLLLYHSENRIEELWPLLKELIDLIRDEPDDCGLSQGKCFSIYTIYNEYFGTKYIQEHLNWLKDMVLEIYRHIKKDVTVYEDCYRELTVFLCTSFLLFAETGSDFDYSVSLEIFRQIQSNFTLNDSVQILMFRTIVRIAAELGISSKAYMDECVKLTQTGQVSEEAKAEVLQAAASFYCGAGQYDEGRTCLCQALDMITQRWHFYVRYFDKLAYQILEPLQLDFLGCYDTIRKYMKIDFAYEKVLQFKAIASLAGRERNRALYSGRIDPELLRAIPEIQNRVAWKETAKIFSVSSAELEDDKPVLRSLQADFVEKYPTGLTFVDISLDRVKKALPDDSAVVEYLFYEIDYEKHEFSSSSPERETAIDIYVLCKRNGICTLERRTVSDGKCVLAQARKFISVLSQPDRISWTQKEDLRRALYQKLIKPILPYINGIECLYIAPDRELINLPFEILGDGSAGYLEEYHNIIRIECARDILFSIKKTKPANGSIIIGNPQFAVNSNSTKIPVLPFSELEAQRVSEYCGCRYYSGPYASKKRLLTASGHRNIHIATHGSFDTTGKMDSMYSSSLLFAGVEDWQHSGKIDEVYGNGIVTADEIGRMDLRGTELVVLSACWSGMNKVLEDKGFHGLLSAFSATGVQYVVSNLWEADDLSTTILMDRFYYYYIREKNAPPIALNLAKQYLREVTIGQLRSDGWFEYLTNSDTQNVIHEYRVCNDKKRPFESEEYWGGFVCCKCN